MIALFASQLISRVIEARNWSRQVGPQWKRWIVLHSMQYPLRAGTALWCAEFFRDQQPGPSGSSAHFAIDAKSIIQCVPAELVAWHAPGANQLGIGLEHGGYAEQDAPEWLDDDGRAMLTRSAQLCAELCQHFSIPTEFVDAEGLRAGHRGITTHAKVTEAWPGKSHGHTDPGPAFPIDYYLELVRGHLLGAPSV